MKIRVLAAVLDTRQLTLYQEDGYTTVLPQGDYRIRGILDTVTPIITAGGVAEVELVHDTNASVYENFEQKSSGLVKFYRIAKSKIAKLFGNTDDDAETTEADPIAPIEIYQPNAAVKVDALNKLNTALDDIMVHAVPVTSPEYQAIATTSDDTMIAVVNNQIIPGVEQMKNHINHAAKTGSTIGTTNFMRRCAAIISKRGHTVQELLNFITKGDLEFADDGSIIAYKVLKTGTLDGRSVIVDCYTSKVPQQVGSFVCMDESLVDPSRRTECSTGLHIARRGYLGSFDGDVITLVKIAPEDVIAVPIGEPNKMRVRGYHIVFRIPKECHSELRSNKPMTENSEAGRLLGMAIRGEHPAPFEEVRINGRSGSGVTINKFGEAPVESVPDVALPVSKAIEPLIEPEKIRAPDVNPKAIAQEIKTAKADTLSKLAEHHEKTVAAPVAAPATPAVENRVQKAKRLYDTAMGNADLALQQAAACELLAFRKASKIGWNRLELRDSAAGEMQDILDRKPEPVAEPKKQDRPVIKTEPTRQIAAAELSKLMFTSKSESARKDAAIKLKAFKKTSKVSWEKLGFDGPTIVQQIDALLK